MKIKQIPLVVALSAVISVPATATENFNGKSLALSGAGVANTHYSHGVLLNPANAVRYQDSDDFNLNINVGLVGSDEDDLIDNADDLSNQLDLLNTLDINTPVSTLTDIRDTLAKLDNANADIAGGGSLTIGIPGETVSAVFYVNGVAGIEAGMRVSDQDLADIDALITAIEASDPGAASSIDVDNLSSQVVATGVIMREVGIAFAKTFEVKGKSIAVGITPKHQNVETIVYNETVANIDSDNFDADQFTTEDSNLNLDIGLSTHWDQWYAGISVSNLVSQDYATVNPTQKVKIETQTTVGGSYNQSWGSVALDLDLNPVQYLGTSKDVQFIKLGGELNLWRTVQLRLGYRHDLKNSFDDTVSIGVGLSPFDVVNLDLAAMVGGDDTMGAAIQLGVSF